MTAEATKPVPPAIGTFSSADLSLEGHRDRRSIRRNE